MTIDAKAFGEELAAIVKSETGPLLERIEAQAKRIEALEKALADRPELPDIPALVDEAVSKAVAEIPVPQDGKDGTSVTVDDVLPALEKRVDDYLATIPAPKDGVDGKDGKDGAPGERGEKGADGVGLAGALIDRDGVLILTLTNGETKALGQVIGKDGAPGRDGADGLGFDDLEFVEDDYGRPIAKFSRGDVIKTVPLPCIIDRGVFKADEEYSRGDAVSYGGSLWIAQKDAPEGRPDGGPDWRLAVKKGRDGRDNSAKKVL